MAQTTKIPEIKMYYYRQTKFDQGWEEFLRKIPSNNVFGYEVDSRSKAALFFTESEFTEQGKVSRPIYIGEDWYTVCLNTEFASIFPFTKQKSDVLFEWIWQSDVPFIFQCLVQKKNSYTKQIVKQKKLFEKGVKRPSRSIAGQLFQEFLIEMLPDNRKKKQTISKAVEKKEMQEGYELCIRFLSERQHAKRLKETVQILIDRLNTEEYENHYKLDYGDFNPNYRTFKNGLLVSKQEMSLWFPKALHDEQTPLAEIDSQTETIIEPKHDLLEIETEKKALYDYDWLSLLPLGLEKFPKPRGDYWRQKIENSYKMIGIETKLDLVTNISGPTVELIGLKPREIDKTKSYKKLVGAVEEIGRILNIDLFAEPIKGIIEYSIPHQEKPMVLFADIVRHVKLKNEKIPILLGISPKGELLVTDLTKIRHVLVAGTTGSGKSVWALVNLILILLWMDTKQVEMHLIDPKQVEFEMLQGFPQVKNIITDMKQAEELLSKLVEHMEERYTTFKGVKARNLDDYNQRVSVKDRLPYIVVAIDEYADLRMAHEEVEDYILRLGQKARGAGIHLLIATQRPSHDVISTTLRSNMPCRVVFRLNAGSDYETVLERRPPYSLQGKGDGIVSSEIHQGFIRFQGPRLAKTDLEEEQIIELLKGYCHAREIGKTQLAEFLKTKKSLKNEEKEGVIEAEYTEVATENIENEIKGKNSETTNKEKVADSKTLKEVVKEEEMKKQKEEEMKQLRKEMEEDKEKIKAYFEESGKLDEGSIRDNVKAYEPKYIIELLKELEEENFINEHWRTLYKLN